MIIPDYNAIDLFRFLIANKGKKLHWELINNEIVVKVDDDKPTKTLPVS